MGHHLSESLLAGWFEDVSAHPDWQALVGRRIVRTGWIDLPGVQAAQVGHDPCAMELTSEGGGSVQIMAANLVQGNGMSLMPGDDVVIVFGQSPSAGPPLARP